MTKGLSSQDDEEKTDSDEIPDSALHHPQTAGHNGLWDAVGSWPPHGLTTGDDAIARSKACSGQRATSANHSTIDRSDENDRAGVTGGATICIRGDQSGSCKNLAHKHDSQIGRLADWQIGRLQIGRYATLRCQILVRPAKTTGANCKGGLTATRKLVEDDDW